MILLSITISGVLAILTTIVGFIFPFIWKRIKGYRTKLISVLQAIIALSIFLSATILPKLSEILSLDTAKVVGIILLINAFIQYLLRLIVDTPAGDMLQLLKRFGTEKQAKDEVQKLKRRKTKTKA